MQKFYSYSDSGHPELLIPKSYNERHYVKIVDENGKTCPGDYPINSIGYVPEHGVEATNASFGKEREIVPIHEMRWRDKSDKDSFKSIRKSGAVKMTPWSAGNITTHKFVAELNPFYTSIGVGSEIYITDNDLSSECRMSQRGPKRYEWNKKQTIQKRVYRTSMDHIREDFGDVPKYKLEPNGDRDKLANAAKASVVSELASSFDLLTEIGEFSETANFIVTMLRKAQRPTELFTEIMAKKRWKQGTKMSKDMSSAWLQYRYAVMPIYYSILDAIETFAEARSIYKTARRKESINFTSPIRDMSRTHIFEDGSKTTLISAVGKVGFSSTADRLLNQIRFNPLATAWELVKFSWIVDWFVNIGDWITSQSSAFGVDRDAKYCISFTDEFVVNTSLFIPPMESIAPSRYSVEPKGNIRTDPMFKEVINDSGGLFLLQTVSGRTYSRDLFDPTDVHLSFNPSLNWKRGLDALSLAVGKTSFRRFK